MGWGGWGCWLLVLGLGLGPEMGGGWLVWGWGAGCGWGWGWDFAIGTCCFEVGGVLRLQIDLNLAGWVGLKVTV